jgi:phosphatidylglycerophosphatase A
MKKLLTSCFGLGFLPFAPGTWGSVPAVLIFAVLSMLDLQPTLISIIMVGIVAAASAVCVLMSPEVIRSTGKKDPSQIVADEVAGQAITFLVIFPTSTYQILICSVIGFVAFRFFDILKPFPCKKLENLPSGWGILADDLMAGVYAAIVLQICIKFL